MKTIKTFVKNSIANYGQKIIRTCVGLVTIGIIARYLSPDMFGQYAYILAFLTISEVTSGMGVPVILCREVAQDKAKAPVLIAAGLTLQFLLSITTIGILSLTFYFVAPSAGLFWAAMICAFAEILRFLERFFWAVYQAFEKMGYGTLQTSVSQTLRLIVTIVAVKNDLGLHGLFGALLLSHLGGVVFGYNAVCRLFARPEFRDVKSLSKFLLKESYPLAIRGVFRKLNYRAGTLILAGLRTDFEVGMFNGAHKIIMNLLFISEASSQAIFPILSRFTVSSQDYLKIAFEKVLKFSLLIGLPLAIYLSRFSEGTISVILGSKYLESASVLRVLGWALVPLFMAGFTQRILVAGNRQGLTSIAMAAALIVNLVLNFTFIPKMGYMGAGIATTVSEIVPLVLNLYFAWKYLNLSIPISVILKPLLAGMVTCGVLVILPDMNMLLGAFVEMVVYTGVVCAVGTFTREEIGAVKDLLRRAASANAMTG